MVPKIKYSMLYDISIILKTRTRNDIYEYLNSKLKCQVSREITLAFILFL